MPGLTVYHIHGHIHLAKYQVGGDMQIVGIAYLCHAESDMVILSEAVSDFKWVTASELSEYIENKGVLNDLKNAGII